MKVEMDVFSGRPNPAWEITPTDAVRVVSAVARLPEYTPEPDDSPVLGYRGLRVTGIDFTMTVRHERITIDSDHGRSWSWDEKREVETMLGDMASDAAITELIAGIRAES